MEDLRRIHFVHLFHDGTYNQNAKIRTTCQEASFMYLPRAQRSLQVNMFMPTDPLQMPGEGGSQAISRPAILTEMLLLPLVPRLPKNSLALQQAAALLLDCMTKAVCGSSDELRAASIRRSAWFNSSCSALMKLMDAAPDRMYAVLSENMSRGRMTHPPWPKLCQRLQQSGALKRPASATTSRALLRLNEAYKALASRSQQQSRESQAADVTAAAAAELSSGSLGLPAGCRRGCRCLLLQYPTDRCEMGSCTNAVLAEHSFRRDLRCGP